MARDAWVLGRLRVRQACWDGRQEAASLAGDFCLLGDTRRRPGGSSDACENSLESRTGNSFAEFLLSPLRRAGRGGSIPGSAVSEVS